MGEKRTFILVEDWMWEQLGLGGDELLVYAIVYGFSVREGGVCYASQNWIALRLKCERKKVIRILQRLVDRGLVVKKGRSKTNIYVAAAPKHLSQAGTDAVPKKDRNMSPKGADTCPAMGHKKKEKKKMEKDSQNTGEIRTNITEEDLAWVNGTKTIGAN